MTRQIRRPNAIRMNNERIARSGEINLTQNDHHLCSWIPVCICSRHGNDMWSGLPLRRSQSDGRALGNESVVGCRTRPNMQVDVSTTSDGQLHLYLNRTVIGGLRSLITGRTVVERPNV